MTIQSNSPLLMLASSLPDPLSSVIVVTIPEGQTSAQFYVQGLSDTGSATYTASASGMGSATALAQFAP